MHRKLEEQVHTIVPVKVHTKEDGWGLRIWNVIQGLRTLRASGMTRELEVWGVVDGQVVNGIIDHLSYTCPDSELEAELMAKEDKKSKTKSQPLSQQAVNHFFQGRSNEINHPSSAFAKKIYLTDVKTRTKATLPTGAALRPPMMQLMLYHSLFVGLASNNVSADVIFRRYNLDSAASFTDSFVSEVSALDFNFVENSNIDDENAAASLGSVGEIVGELAQHNNLTLMWQLMVQEFQRTVPDPSCVGKVLCAEFVHAREQVVLGSKCFAFDEEELQQYVADEMQWWKGERSAKGVEIEEAYKCRMCEFAEECTWRKEKIEEAVGRHRQRRKQSLDA